MRLLRCLAAALVPLLPGAEAAAQPRVTRIAAQVTARVAAAGTADVLVALVPPVVASRASVRARALAAGAARDAVLARLDPRAVRVRHRFAVASGFTATVSAAGVAQLLADPAVRRIDPPRSGSGAALGVPQIRADQVQHRGDRGEGVTVAVLDTGVDPTHPDLAGSIVGEQCFCTTVPEPGQNPQPCCPDGTNEQSGPGSAFTTAVHGIHVTGIIVSKGLVAPVGVAPAAHVVAVKVLDDANSGELAEWIKALDWIATSRPDVQAINMSLVSNRVYPGVCDEADAYTMLFAQEIAALRVRGTLTFAASGNAANTQQTEALAAPACVGAAVAVGAVDSGDVIWPLTDRDAKLDLLAPGVQILSTGLDGSTMVLTGTSMATPHATGTAALLLAMNPQLGADALEGILKGTGAPVNDVTTGLTFRRVDALAAMNAVLDTSEPLAGGGSRLTDCLVEWNFGAGVRLETARIAGATCRDGDAGCDADQVSGQCTFEVTACFNVPDRRLPDCATDSAIVSYTVNAPRGGSGADALDAANAAAMAAVLPQPPLSGLNQCASPFAFVVPAGASKWIRFAAVAADGRRDSDRLRLQCLPAQ